MRPVRVKFCGLVRPEDGRLAGELGVDAVGFVFWPQSPRQVSVEAARQIADVLPLFVSRVGVFVNSAPGEVAAVVRDVGLDVVQLHGDERPEDYAGAASRLIKAVALSDERDLDGASALPAHVLPLVDAVASAQRGGTGRLADWRLASELSRRRPILLAGGLTPHNVLEAVRLVRPQAVDVSSGVESAPGVKDAAKMRAFIAAMERAREEVA